MRRVTQHETGGPEVLRLEEAPVPEPFPTEVRVRVHAAGVNPVDGKNREGGAMAPVLGELPYTLGYDAAGVVDAVGLGVNRFAVGDRVFGMPWFPYRAGCYADYVTAPSRHFSRIPDDVDDVTAGATPLAALTAWQMLLDVADVRAGQRVLIHAAGGGVGHLAVQIAASRGAHVIGTAGADKHDALRALGLAEPIDHRSVAFEDVITEPVDLVVDATELYSFRSLDVLREGGLEICVPSGVPEGLEEKARAQGKRVTDFLVEPDHTAMDGVAAMLASGALSVHVAGSFDLGEAADAHRALERGSTFGKWVLTTV